MSAAAIRAWYLPTWVNMAMPVTSPIAQTPGAARIRSSTSTPRFEISTPSCSKPSPSVCARRPVAISSRSARTEAPPSRATRPGSTWSILAPRCSATPSFSSTSASIRPASSSTLGSSRSATSTIGDPGAEAAEELGELTSHRPRADDRDALGHLLGPRRVPVRPVLDAVQAGDRRDRRRRPGGDRRACRRAALGRRRRQRPAGRRAPRRAPASAPLDSSHSACDESSQPFVIWSRCQNSRSASTGPVTASAAPGTLRAAATASGGRSIPLVGMQA